MIEDRTPEAVAAELESDPNAVLLDVRTVGEFEAGHAPGALNVPVAEPSPATGMMAPNPDFLAVVQASISSSATVYCTCATGPRSRHAVTLLLGAGYPAVFNVAPGFNGMTDFLGRSIEPGWAERGLAVEVGDGGAFGYAALAAAAMSTGEPRDPDG